jgi:hypothetical protein
MNPANDPKLQQRRLKSWGKMVTKERIGLILGPLLDMLY